MFDLDDLTRQVLENCDISDARHAGLYSTCGLALRLRDLYKWEKGLNPWEEKDSSEILDWIGHKEQKWEKLADKNYVELSLQGKQYDPFDTIDINQVLETHGLLYGAGYAYRLKPAFFLSAIENKGQTAGHTVYTLGQELARDLLTLPALSQDNSILLRTESAKLFLWDQISYIRKSGRPALRFALEQCGLKEQTPQVLQGNLTAILAAQKDNYIYHEIGEMQDTVFTSNIWREIIAAFPHTPIELLTRAVKDLLADTNEYGTLPHLARKRKAAALGFYVAFYDGMVKELFPELRLAFKDFIQTGNWHIIEEAVSKGYHTAKGYAEEIIYIYKKGKQKINLKWAKNELEKRLLCKIRKEQRS
jgi:hypothetical protein